MDEKILIENTMEIVNEEDIIIKKLHIPTTKIEMEDSILVTGSNAVDGNIMQIDPINHEERDDLVECIFEEHEAITFADDDGTEETAAATVSLEQVKTEKDMSVGDLKEIIDKDDPRSRLHFVKYLKRGGKTLKIWECGICTKEFRHQYTLMRHLPTHTDERNFKCEMCGKAFRQMSTLSQHRAIHSDARPYICEICKKTFNRVSTLISHRKTHSEKKPHTCRVCGKGFHQKGNLRNHVFTHTNERPYRCNICGKGFNQMSNLMCHKVKLCEAEAAKNSIRNLENETYGIRQENGKIVEYSLGDNRKKRNMKFVQHVSDDEEDDEEEGVDSPEQSACDDTADSEEEPSAGVCIEPIQTKAMRTARSLGQTPFALLKPARGMPVLVKVVDLPNKSKQMLVPATAEDLKNAGKVTVSPSVQSEAMKAVQIKVPVVATVIQQILPDGSLAILIEPPSNESFPKKASHVAKEPQMSPCDDIITEYPNDEETDENMQYVVADDNGSVEWIVEDGNDIENCTEDISQTVVDFEHPEVYVLEDVVSNNGDVTEDEA